MHDIKHRYRNDENRNRNREIIKFHPIAYHNRAAVAGLYSHDIGACEVVEVIAQHIAQLESASTERIYLYVATKTLI